MMTPFFKSLLISSEISSFSSSFFWYYWYTVIFSQSFKVNFQTMFYIINNTSVWGDSFPHFKVVFYIACSKTGAYIQFLWYLLLCLFGSLCPCVELLCGIWLFFVWKLLLLLLLHRLLEQWSPLLFFGCLSNAVLVWWINNMYLFWSSPKRYAWAGGTFL